MGGLSSFAGNLTGGIIGTSDAERAVPGLQRISEAAKQESLGELGASWKDIQGYLQPFLDIGKEALGSYRAAINAPPGAPLFENFSFDPTQMEQNPAYQFVRDQAMQAVNRSAAKNRGLTSGNRAIALQDRAAGLASTEYGNEFQRQLQTYGANQGAQARNFDISNLLYRQKVGDLGNLATTGVNTAGNLSQFRQNLGSQRTGIITNRAAEATAANLIPIQERQNFMQGLLSGGGAALGGYLASDRRIKENIESVGKLDNGLTVYKFNYIGDDTVHIGLMAQEVEEVNPDAVIEIDGIKHVYYDKATRVIH